MITLGMGIFIFLLGGVAGSWLNAATMRQR